MNLYDIEAERAVLGTMILESEKIPILLAELDPADFMDPTNRAIYQAACNVYQSGDAVDPITIKNELERSGRNGTSISELAELTGGAFIGNHHKIVKRYSRSRCLLKELRAAQQALLSGGDVDEVIQDFSPAFANHKSGSGLQSLGETIPAAVEKIFERADSDLKLAGILSGFVDLDQYTSGLVASNLIILAGRPSMGKSTLALNIAENVARSGRSVLFFSLEMSADELGEKLISRDSGVPLERIRNGTVSERDRREIEKAASCMYTLPLFIQAKPALSMTQITAEAKGLHLRNELSLVVLDYLQLMKGTGQTREQEVAGISAGLKSLAMDLKVPVVALSQLNRAVESRNDKRPTLADLRDSGAIEQDANIVAFIYRDEMYDPRPDNPKAGTAEIIVAKNRAGRTGHIRLSSAGLDCSEFRQFSNRRHAFR